MQVAVSLFDDVQEQVDFWFQLAEELYDRTFNRPDISLDLRGKTAGQAYCHLQYPKIRINRQLMEENGQEFYNRTIPHEVAHIVASQLTDGKCKPHGTWWKSVMRDFGCEATRCHSYDTTNARQRTVPRKHVYACSCQTILFTSIRHKRSQEHGGQYYRCRKCNTDLTYQGPYQG